MRANIIELYSEIKELEAQENHDHKAYIQILKRRFIEKARKAKISYKYR